MFGMGPSEIVVILLIALIVLGPKRLPDIARSLGRGLAEFRRASSDLRSAVLDDPPTKATQKHAAQANQAEMPELTAVNQDVVPPTEVAAATPATPTSTSTSAAEKSTVEKSTAEKTTESQSG